MPDSVACPQCRRQLRLPADLQEDLVRCPACGADFSLASARVPSPPPLEPPSEEVVDVLPADDEPVHPAAQRPRWQDDEAPRRPARRSSGVSCFHVFLVVALVSGASFAALVGFVLLVSRNTSRPTVASRFEDDEDEPAPDLREAFRDHKPVAVEEIPRELAPLFENLGTAIKGDDTGPIVAHFDIDRMTDEFADLANLRLRTRKERRPYREGLREGMRLCMARRSPLFRWDTSAIRKVKKLNEVDAVVIVRHEHADGTAFRMRWWTSRRSGTWKVYDFEDLDTGIRLLATMAVLQGRGPVALSESGRAFKTLAEALQAVVIREDLDTAEQHLRQIEGVKLPPRIEAMRLMVVGLVHLRRGRFKECLKPLEEAQRLNPDMPIVDFLRGKALNALGKWEEAIKPLRAYRDLLGDEDEVCREEADALRGLRRFDEAAGLYRKALDLNPKDADAFQGFLRSLGDDEAGDVGPRFGKLDAIQENFDIFAAECERRAIPALLEPIVRTMRKIDANYPPVDYYDSLVKARTRHPDEAVILFRSSLRREKDVAKRREYADGFLKAMASVGEHAKAYTAAPEPREAFRTLAADAMEHYRTDQLRKLVAAHRKKNADDPLLTLYQAEILARDGRYALADKTFADALARPPDADALKRFRPSRVLARYHNGQGLSAYRDIGPRDETFPQLAELCLTNDNTALLQTLLDEHARNDPKDIDLSRYRFRLMIRQKRTDEAIALFKTVLAKRLPAEKREEVVLEFLMDMASAGKSLEAYRAAPDAESAFRTILRHLRTDERREDLRRLMDAHRIGHAGDPWLALEQARLHENDKEWDKAARVLKDALKKAPEGIRESLRSSLVYCEFQIGRALQAYGEIGPRDQTFRQLADLLANAGKGDDLLKLIEAHRPHAGNDPDLLYFAARARLALKRPAEATPLYRQACQEQKVDFKRWEYVRRFLIDMTKAGQGLEGYRATPDRSQGFSVLAGLLVGEKKDKELAALIAEHGKDHGGEALTEYYTGEAFLLRGDAAGAEPHFAAAVARGAANEQWRFRNGLIRARIRLGEAVSTYEEHKRTPGIFESIVGECRAAKDAGQLQALLATYRKDNPDDPSLSSHELEALWLKHDYGGALRLLDERREDVFDLPRYRWQADDYRVRALVKLKRTAEAIKAAEASAKHRYGNQLLLILAHAAAGDVGQAIAVVEKGRSKSYLLRSYYDDADLGPILQGEAFAAFRAMFPRPKDEDPREDRDFDDD